MQATRSATRQQRWLLITVALGVFVAADDQTSIVTVLPPIVNDIGLTVDDIRYGRSMPLTADPTVEYARRARRNGCSRMAVRK